MTDADAFEAALDDAARPLWSQPARPHRDPEILTRLGALRLVYADWLEEQGDVTASRGQRWLAHAQRCPRAAGTAWEWWRYGDRPDAQPEDLPAEIWDRLPGRPARRAPQCKEYDSRRDAERALCHALKILGPLTE